MHICNKCNKIRVFIVPNKINAFKINNLSFLKTEWYRQCEEKSKVHEQHKSDIFFYVVKALQLEGNSIAGVCMIQ